MNQAQDEAVIATNDDASTCKRFAVQLGYWKDKYIQYFAKLGERKTPEINRGYYARTKGLRLLLDQFLALTECNCQVVSFGAGFDTQFWQLKGIKTLWRRHFDLGMRNSTEEEGMAPKVYVEVDFDAVTRRKSYSIRTRKQMQAIFTAEDDLKIDTSEVHSRCYHLLAVDLRDTHSLDAKFTQIGLDRSLPTLFMTECVFVYMEPEHSAAIIDWVGKNFTTALFINYEQVNMQDRFGQVMIQNLKSRNCLLLGALACPDLESQKQRYLSHNWHGAEAREMTEVYRCLPSDDLARVEKLEFLDEVNLLHQLLAHYCISWAYNDDKQIGLSSIGY